jgi:hypothetical protein
MVVWSANDAAPPMRAPGTTERAQAAYLRHRPADALADARSWGFDHGVRRPRILFESAHVMRTM